MLEYLLNAQNSLYDRVDEAEELADECMAKARRYREKYRLAQEDVTAMTRLSKQQERAIKAYEKVTRLAASTGMDIPDAVEHYKSTLKSHKRNKKKRSRRRKPDRNALAASVNPATSAQEKENGGNNTAPKGVASRIITGTRSSEKNLAGQKKGNILQGSSRQHI